MPKAIINGKEAAFENGMTILQAARSAGVFIPVLCEHPALEAVGACRICLVEIEGSPKLAAACSTPAADGMVVFTDTENVRSVRRAVVELMLARHPLECFSCTSNGSCLLQDIAYDLGVESAPFGSPADIPKEKPDESSAYYVRDMRKCILCGRCIRVCEQFARYSALGFAGRGLETRVTFPFNEEIKDSNCTACGQCAAVCPVGAIYSRPAMHKGRAWDVSRTETVCPYCGVGCSVVVETNNKTGRVANVTTDHTNKASFNKGRSCVKGRFAWEFVNSPDRLTKPLIKENGRFREASWDEAMSLTAARLKSFRPEEIGFCASARCTNEDNFVTQRFAREVIGTNNIDHCAHL